MVKMHRMGTGVGFLMVMNLGSKQKPFKNSVCDDPLLKLFNGDDIF